MLKKAIKPICLMAWLSGGTSLLAAPGGGALKTPSHVFQETENIIAEVRIMRRAKNVTKTPRDPGVQLRKLPLHVYGKSLEVLEKVSHVQIQAGLTPVQVPQIPLRKVTPTDVFGSAQKIVTELRRLKVKWGISERIEPARFVKGKTPSDVYENLWRASYLLDGLASQISPDLVFRNTQYVIGELRRIGPKLGISLEFDAPEPIAGKKPRDVNIEGFKNLHKTSRLERNLGISPFRPPSFPAGQIIPSDVYDTTNMLLTEFVRIKVALGITTPRGETAMPSGKKPSDVLAQMQLIGMNLDRLIEGARIGQ